MAERRKYTRKTKMAAVIAAEMSTVQAAAQASGIPETTVRYWFDAPEFVALRTKTREDMAAESMGMAHLVLSEIRRRLDEFEPRDLSVLLGILVDKGQLLSGAATGRMETRDITDTLDDHERTQLRDAIEDWLKVPVAE